MKKAERGFRKGRHRYLLIASLIMALAIGGMNSLTVFADTETSETPEAVEITETAGENSQVTERTKPENLNQAGYDIVYVIDNSLSIWEDEQKARNQAFKNITNLSVGSNNRIGALYFADHVNETKDKIELTEMKKKEDYTKVISFLSKEEIDKDNQDTNIGNALESARKLFDGQNPSRERIIILFSDGDNKNVAESREYKEQANRKTEEEVKILEEMGIKIYCVYLEKDPERSDADYLRSLVNYFHEEDEDVHYDEERFQSVPMDDLSSLSPTFADVFYKMQNNMKYVQIRKEDLDSNGRKGFYIPSMGIKRLDLYLDGSVGSIAQVTWPEECEYASWSDESNTSTFYTFINPVPGDWAVTIEGDVPDNFFGTIACYANLSADIEVQDTGSKSMHKAVARFYDENGEAISIDNSAEVTMEYIMPGEDESSAEPLNMSIQNDMAVSDNFALKEFGDYRFLLRMTYKDSLKDFVNLSYEVPFKYENQPPITYDQIGKTYHGKKGAGGLQVSIDKSELFKDPEGEAVKVTGVTQLVSSNKVTVEETEGFILLTSEKSGDFAVKLTVEDENGAAAELKIQGKMWNVVMEWLLIIAICIAAAALLIWLFIKSREKKNLKNKYERAYQNIVNTYENWNEGDNNIKQHEDNLEALDKKIGEHLKGYTEGDTSYPGIIDYAEGMPESVQEIFGIEDYTRENYTENLFAQSEIIKGEIKGLEKKRAKLKKQVDEEYEKEKEFDNEAMKLMDDRQKEMADLNNQLENKIKELTEEISDISDTEKEMRNIRIDEFVEGEFYCDVRVSGISGYEGVVGFMSQWVGFNRARRTGYYYLDDIKALGSDKTLKSLGIDSDILVINYYDVDTERDGILLKAADRFYVKERTGTYNPYEEKCIFQGEAVQIRIKGDIEMKVTVE